MITCLILALIKTDDPLIADEPQSDKSQVDTHTDTKSTLRKFLDLKFNLKEILEISNPSDIIKQCSSLMASEEHKISLFSDKLMVELRKETKSSVLMQYLSPFVNWSDYSLLKEITGVYQNSQFTRLFSQFETNLDTSQPLLDYPIAKPVHQMLPKDNSTHTVLAVQLDLQLQEMSLQDVFDMRNFILKKCEVTPHTLQLLSVAQGSSTILYWMISRCVVPLVTSKVSQNLTDLHQKGILHVAIYPSTILATGKALSVGPLSFLTCFDEMVSVVIRCVH